jgi:internalin A
MDKLTLKIKLEGAQANKKGELILVGLGLVNIPEEIRQFKWLKFLDIRSNNIDIIPEFLSDLPLLEEIDLGSNNISEVPAYISNFKSLKTLSLKYNKIKILPEGLGYIKNLKKLDLEGNKIDKLPTSFKKLSNLKNLNLSNNKLKTIPSEIYSLKKIEVLNLNNNAIKCIDDIIENSENLVSLSIQNNNLSIISPKIGNLINLSVLDLYNNKLKEIPEDVYYLPKMKDVSFDQLHLGDNTSSLLFNSIRLKKNPIVSPPLEILYQGINAIRNYYRELKESDSFLYEAKLLVLGEAGAGKTSLCRKIINPKAELPNEECTTKGIDISKYTFETTDKQLHSKYLGFWGSTNILFNSSIFPYKTIIICFTLR